MSDLTTPVPVLTKNAIEQNPQDSIDAICGESGSLILIDKPYGETSFYVVNHIRKAISSVTGIKKVKVGHAGTLDPLASGLLILATRRGTKQLDRLLGLDKVYLVKLRLGIDSPSHDLETRIEHVSDLAGLDSVSIIAALEAIAGELSQIPPDFSAIKQKGKPVYLQARRGEEVTLQARNVFIHDLAILAIELPYVTFRVHCSKGTYVRSLVRDLGVTLGTGAVLTDLVRENIGEWSLTDAIELDTLNRFIRSNTPHTLSLEQH